MYAVIYALVEYLKDYGLEMHLADCVPQGASFPYLTAAASLPCAGDGQGHIDLTLWCAGPLANTSRLMMHGTLMQYFPHRGLTLQTDEGLAILRPGTVTLVQEGAAIGIRTALDVRFFPQE